MILVSMLPRIGRLHGNEVTDPRCASEMIAISSVLESTIGLGDPVMLAKMLDPRFDQESFYKSPFLCGIGEYSP